MILTHLSALFIWGYTVLIIFKPCPCSPYSHGFVRCLLSPPNAFYSPSQLFPQASSCTFTDVQCCCLTQSLIQTPAVAPAWGGFKTLWWDAASLPIEWENNTYRGLNEIVNDIVGINIGSPQCPLCVPLKAKLTNHMLHPVSPDQLSQESSRACTMTALGCTTFMPLKILSASRAYSSIRT